MNVDVKSLIEYSDGFTKSRSQMKAYLSDILQGTEIRNINLLLNVYESGIAKRLWVDKQIVKATYVQYIKKLNFDYCMDLESSIKALNIWIEACVGENVGLSYGKELIETKRKEALSFKQSYTVILDDSNLKIAFNRIEKVYDDKFKCWTWEAEFYIENKIQSHFCCHIEDLFINGEWLREATGGFYVRKKQTVVKKVVIFDEDDLLRELHKTVDELGKIEEMEFVFCYAESRDDDLLMAKNGATWNESGTIKFRFD